MGLEIGENKQNEPIIIEIVEYDNFKSVLSKIVEPFSEYIRSPRSPDLYNGQEKISFGKRYPNYKELMYSEFENAMREYEILQIKEFFL